ncbi:hypothetical protein ATO67_13580 [Agrobacterium bohemicum]|uniref:Uncharacterized protein n=1 Tax=Agrobacterium bohemicum TaxID=2052828 RepID=A0A135NY06_9HYPH|nr:hypothetical protein ATO67_13580 [Agrobacterium bohemicum]
MARFCDRSLKSGASIIDRFMSRQCRPAGASGSHKIWALDSWPLFRHMHERFEWAAHLIGAVRWEIKLDRGAPASTWSGHIATSSITDVFNAEALN